MSLKKTFAKVTKKQTTEFGQVTVLASIFFSLYFKENRYVVTSFILSLATLTVPVIFYPFAVVWFGLSKILAAVTSKVLLGVVFFLVVMPVGLCRKLLGSDGLKIRQFKKSRGSVMAVRDHWYTHEDLLHSF
jgi:hypothetical protein